MGETQNKKYHITEDGDVYKVNDDGSFTSMGNAENIKTAPSDDSPLPEEKPISKNAGKTPGRVKKVWWIIAAVVIVLLTGGLIIINNISNKELTVSEGETISEEKTAQNSEIVTNQDDELKSENQIEVKPEKNEEKTPVISKGSQSMNQSGSEEKIYPNNSESIKVEPSVPKAKEPTTNNVDQNKIYNTVTEEAQFPGGDKARRQWLRDHIQWPIGPDGEPLRGRVDLDFVIEPDGSVSSVKVTDTDDAGLNEAAIRLIRSMPKWSPARVRGEAVRSPMGISLYF